MAIACVFINNNASSAGKLVQTACACALKIIKAANDTRKRLRGDDRL